MTNDCAELITDIRRLGRFRRPLNPLTTNSLRVKKGFGTCFFDVLPALAHLGPTRRIAFIRRAPLKFMETTMSAFCRNCGSSLNDSVQFCGKCGTPTTGAPIAKVPSATFNPSNAPAASPSAATPSAAPQGVAAARTGMSTGAKVAIAAILIIFVGGGVAVAGMVYAAHRVSQRVHAIVKGEIQGDDAPNPGSGSGSGSASAGGSSRSASEKGSMGNVCRYLSADTVSSAIGVPIVRAVSEDNACNYFAKGTQAQMTAKHMSSMMATKGADPKTQKMIEGITGALAQSFQTDKAEKSDADNADGTVIVFNFSLDDNNAAAQMSLNRKGMAYVGGGSTQDMPDIADEAFVTGDASIMARKGNTMIRVMYMSCPCNTIAVEPLVKKIAAAL
jgi:zinc-ribbon domain